MQSRVTLEYTCCLDLRHSKRLVGVPRQRGVGGLALESEYPTRTAGPVVHFPRDDRGLPKAEVLVGQDSLIRFVRCRPGSGEDAIRWICTRNRSSFANCKSRVSPSRATTGRRLTAP